MWWTAASCSFDKALTKAMPPGMFSRIPGGIVHSRRLCMGGNLLCQSFPSPSYNIKDWRFNMGIDYLCRCLCLRHYLPGNNLGFSGIVHIFGVFKTFILEKFALFGCCLALYCATSARFLNNSMQIVLLKHGVCYSKSMLWCPYLHAFSVLKHCFCLCTDVTVGRKLLKNKDIEKSHICAQWPV